MKDIEVAGVLPRLSRAENEKVFKEAEIDLKIRDFLEFATAFESSPGGIVPRFSGDAKRVTLYRKNAI